MSNDRISFFEAFELKVAGLRSGFMGRILPAVCQEGPALLDLVRIP